MAVIHVTKDTWTKEVVEAAGTVLVDFWATWCGPCRMIAPILEEVAREHPEIKVCKVDVDKEMELAAAFGIVSIPTLIVMKDGKPVNKSVGVVPKSRILELL